MPTVIIDDYAIHRPDAECEIAAGTSLIEVTDLTELEMRALPEDICPVCFPDLAE